METPLSTKRKRDDDEEEHQDSTTTPADNANESGVVKKQKKKKNVRFDDVTVYYFARSQGFVSVPSQGTITLGMESEHSHVEQYSVADFSRLRRALHKSILRERKLLPPTSSATVENDSDEDEPLPVDDYYFVQPIATRQRRTLLKQAGLVKIDTSEKHELALIRRSREVCGCSCTRETGGCQPSTCDCYLNGIACQVDRLTFPCPCATMLCKNPLGRLEFNQSRVRNHYFDTISRLEAEKTQVAFVRSLVQSDDQSAIASLLSSIVARVELEEADVASILQSVVSSVGDSSPFVLTIPSATTSCATPLANGKEHSSQPARACHASSLRRKTSSSLPSPPMISTELS